ncbi:MAG: T9SS type A sorting domain-containing protein [Calditrichia bacterium]
MKLVYTLSVLLFLFGAFSFAADWKKNARAEKLPLETVRIDINLIDLPLHNDARTGDNGSARWPTGSNHSFLFETGIALSGRVDGGMRASWTSGNIFAREWEAGNLGTNPDDPEVKFYKVARSDTFGSPAYIEWADAVAQGAYFRDLDNNGLYDPFVDQPDLLGDKTFWCAYNDVVDTTQRPRWFKTDPLEVEIHQSVWAYALTQRDLQIVYFRYRMTNKSNTDIEDAYFSIFADADIGDFQDDLVACDTSLNLSYMYNDGEDFDYGINPPAFGIGVVQGPAVNSPGDTAFTYRGDFFAPDTLFDRKRLGMISYTPINKSSGPLNQPTDTTVARLYQRGGFLPSGLPIDPTTFGVGGTLQDDPRFTYSGDPVTDIGWIDIMPQDRRFLINTGPFRIAAGETQDIIMAYSVGQGQTSAAEAITELRAVARNAAEIIKNRQVITGIRDQSGLSLSEFTLNQNYPNPFNPTTAIPFRIEKRQHVSLIVFDVMGKKVATLLDDVVSPGSYQIDFNEQNLPSGIYFYRLRTKLQSQSRKMVLMR